MLAKLGVTVQFSSIEKGQAHYILDKEPKELWTQVSNFSSFAQQCRFNMVAILGCTFVLVSARFGRGQGSKGFCLLFEAWKYVHYLT